MSKSVASEYEIVLEQSDFKKLCVSAKTLDYHDHMEPCCL